MEFIHLFKQGGFIMYPMLLCSIAIWIVTIQKALYLIKFQKDSRKYLTEAIKIIESKKLDQMESLYKDCPEVIAKSHYAVFNETEDHDEYEGRLQRRIGETTADVKKYMWILGTIGSASPFVGLFGTVIGIMDSFKKIGSSGKAGFSVVAESISEALIATATGIIVAVFAVVIYNYFNIKIGALMSEFKNGLGDLSDQFHDLKK